MKNKILIILFVIISCSVVAQQRDLNVNTPGLNNEESQLNLLSAFSLSQQNFQENTFINQGNSVVIQQIGLNNSVFTKTRSQTSDIDVIQNGDFNDVNLIVGAPAIEAQILQNGNNNRVLDNIYYTNLDVKLNAIQNGSNLSINRIGVNSLSNKLQLIQEGNFKTITVISN